MKKIILILLIGILTFTFISCDFLTKIFLKPPLSDTPDDVVQGTFRVIDETSNEISQQQSEKAIFLKIEQNITGFTPELVTWSHTGNAELYSSQTQAILIIHAESGEITVSADYNGRTALYKAVVIGKGTYNNIDNTPINNIYTNATNYTIDINQYCKIPVFNNANKKGVYLMPETSSANIKLFSGTDSIMVQGLSTGSAPVTIYTQDRSLYTTIVVNVSSNIAASTTNNAISTSADVIKIAVGDKYLLTTAVNTQIYTSYSDLISIDLSTNNSHLIRALKSGNGTVVVADEQNNMKEIPVLIFEANGTYSDTSANDIFSLSQTSISLKTNESMLVTIQGVSSTSGITVSVQNGNVSYQKGANGIVVTGQYSGYDTITLSNNTTTKYLNVYVSADIFTPEPSIKTITIQDSVSVKLNDIKQLNYTANDTVTFTTSDDTIASIQFASNTLLVLKGNKEGQCTISALDSEMKLMKTILCTVSLTAQGTGYNTTTNTQVPTINPSNTTLREDEDLIFSISNVNTTDNFTWGISDPNIAVITIQNNTTARIKGVSIGNTYITCTNNDGSYVVKTMLSVVSRNTTATINDYVGINCSPLIEGNIGTSKLIAINPIPQELSGQISFTFTIANTTIAEIESSTANYFYIKFKQPGLTTLQIRDNMNKYVKTVTINSNSVANTQSESNLEINTTLLFLKVGEKKSLSSLVIPCPINISSPENSTVWQADNSNVRLYGTGSVIYVEALSPGTSKIVASNPYTKKDITIYVYIDELSVYLKMNKDVLQGTINIPVTCSVNVCNLPSNWTFMANDILWDVVKEDNTVIPADESAIELQNTVGSNIQIIPRIATKDINYTQYLRARYKQFSTKIQINITALFRFEVDTYTVTMKPDGKDYYINITDIQPTNANLTVMSSSENLFNYEIVKENGIVSKIKLTSRPGVIGSGAIVLCHASDNTVKAKINVISRWDNRFNLNISSMNYDKTNETFTFSCEPYLFITGNQFYRIELLNNQYVSLINTTFNEQTNSGTMTLQYKQFTANIIPLTFRIISETTSEVIITKQINVGFSTSQNIKMELVRITSNGFPYIGDTMPLSVSSNFSFERFPGLSANFPRNKNFWGNIVLDDATNSAAYPPSYQYLDSSWQYRIRLYIEDINGNKTYLDATAIRNQRYQIIGAWEGSHSSRSNWYQTYYWGNILRQTAIGFSGDTITGTLNTACTLSDPGQNGQYNDIDMIAQYRITYMYQFQYTEKKTGQTVDAVLILYLYYGRDFDLNYY